MKNEIAVAVVGLGVGEAHARAYHAHPNCKLKLLYDLNNARAEELAKELKVEEIASDYQSILQRSDIDAISIASFDNDHFSQVVEALKAKKHVFVEKPLCRTLSEAQEIKRLLVSQPQLKLGCNLVLRAAPLYGWLKESLKKGAFGTPYAFDGEYLYGRIHKITGGWRKNVADYSVMEGGGIHLIDLMLWLLAQRPKTVSATGNRICTEGTAFRYKDYMTATFSVPSGLVARITANFGCVHRHQHVLRLYGTQGTFLYDDQGARLHGSRDPDQQAAHVSAAPLPSSKGALIPGFIADIVQNRDQSKDLQCFLDGVCMAAASDRALETGETMEIEYA